MLSYPDGTVLKEGADPVVCRRRFNKGEIVEFHTTATITDPHTGEQHVKKTYIPCKVADKNPQDGLLILHYPDNTLLKQSVDPSKNLHRPVHDVGETIEYWSASGQRWVPCLMGGLWMDSPLLVLEYPDGSILKEG